MTIEEVNSKKEIIESLKGRIQEEIRQLLTNKLDIDIKGDENKILLYNQQLQPTLRLLIDNSDLDFESRYKVWYYFLDEKDKLQKTPDRYKYPLTYKFFTMNDINLDIKATYTVDDILTYINKNIRQYSSGNV